MPLFPGVAGGRSAASAARPPPPRRPPPPSTSPPAEPQRKRAAAATASAAASQPRWEEVDGSTLLLRGREAAPRALLCFAGGALVGAAPQLTYGRFLRLLAERGFWVLAVPYAAGLDYVSVADLLEARFERALARLDAGGAPVWGLGHSLGALAQVLLASRHPPERRRGQILVSYTRRGEEVLPVVRTALASNPLLGPLLRLVDVNVASDFLSQGTALMERALRGAGPRAASAAPGVKDAAALLRQMLPLLREVGLERDDFRPSASRLTSAIREGYRERSTLLVRLADDGLDESPALAAALAGLPADRRAELGLRVLSGQHLVPLLPDLDEALGSAGALLSLRGGASPREGWAEASRQQDAIIDAIDGFITANT